MAKRTDEEFEAWVVGILRNHELDAMGTALFQAIRGESVSTLIRLVGEQPIKNSLHDYLKGRRGISVGSHTGMNPDLDAPQASMRYRAVIDFALSAIRGLLLINGGAIVVLLAFLSTVWTSDAPGARELAINLKIPLGLFLAGAFASTFTALLAYLGQRAIYESWYREARKQKWTARILVGLGILVAFASLIVFGIGSWLAVDAFISST